MGTSQVKFPRNIFIILIDELYSFELKTSQLKMDTGQINLAPCYFIAHAPQTGDLIDYIGILKTRTKGMD